MWYVRRICSTVVRVDLVRLPARVSLIQDVRDGGLHVTQCELAMRSRHGEEELGDTKMKSPA